MKIINFILGVGCGMCLLIGFQHDKKDEPKPNVYITDTLKFYPHYKILVTDSQCWFPVNCGNELE